MEKNSKGKNVLVVDDNMNTAEIIKRNLVMEGYAVITVQNVEEAVELLNDKHFDLVITDNKMPKKSGMELVKYLKDNFPDIGIIMITGYSSINGAVLAIKEGVQEYLTKPFTDSELIETVNKTIKAIKHKKYKDTDSLNKNWGKFNIIGESPLMLGLFSVIEKTSCTDATILITGESGTGKELVARAIHYSHQPRSIHPFVSVNCPGIPESLFESELFGHVKGAFTGAINSRDGLFRAADRGSLFLDEISEIPPSMQAKLLRVLQEKEINVVGKSQSEKVDTRIIAATNRDLEELVNKKQFREDLYFRLNIINIHLPPLRKREDDVILLANYFASKYAKKYQKKQPTFTDNAISALKRYSWPGNVRELENLIQRSVVLNEKEIIDSSDFPERMRFSLSFNGTPLKSLDQVEKEYINRVMNYFNNNKTQAAHLLGIDRKTLREKLKPTLFF